MPALLHRRHIRQAVRGRHRRTRVDQPVPWLRHQEVLAASDPNRPVAVRWRRPGLPQGVRPGELHFRVDSYAAAAGGARAVFLLVLRVHSCEEVLFLPGPAEDGQGEDHGDSGEWLPGPVDRTERRRAEQGAFGDELVQCGVGA